MLIYTPIYVHTRKTAECVENIYEQVYVYVTTPFGVVLLINRNTTTKGVIKYLLLLFDGCLKTPAGAQNSVH